MQKALSVLTKRPGAAALAFVLLAGGAGAAAAAAGKELPPKATLADVIKASNAADWRPLDPENTLYMELPAGRVVIELAPAFAPRHAANIRAMAREHYFDGLAILRSQDNWVVQWGDPDEKNPKPLKTAQAKLAGEFTVPLSNDKHFTRLPDRDGYAPQVGHSNGFPVGRDPKNKQTWLAHCYGMVGVARGNEADSGNGGALYAVIGNAPRHLDRNITVVGRVVSGMSLLSVLPRGAAPMGFYDKPEQMVPIQAVRLAADVPEAERSRLEVMRTDTATYAAAVEAQRNRGGPWTKVAAGHIDLCNAPSPSANPPLDLNQPISHPAARRGRRGTTVGHCLIRRKRLSGLIYNAGHERAYPSSSYPGFAGPAYFPDRCRRGGGAALGRGQGVAGKCARRGFLADYGAPGGRRGQAYLHHR
ncbi:peptidylprolyl isomerase [Massilia sp. MB5]|uniref:peptidylprolyl isomerase n=1 Tax=Massilia sp. MB5 TaxID=2919578 RepID=UPI0027D9B9A9|nr:peptidylprolyl isomerase [Massilia sp. MB5]